MRMVGALTSRMNRRDDCDGGVAEGGEGLQSLVVVHIHGDED